MWDCTKHTQERKINKFTIPSHCFHKCSIFQELQSQSNSLLNQTWVSSLKSIVAAMGGVGNMSMSLCEHGTLFWRHIFSLTARKHLTSNILNYLVIYREPISTDRAFENRNFIMLWTFSVDASERCVLHFLQFAKMIGQKQENQPASMYEVL